MRDLAIDYTALSFVAPEKIRFRYKLEGYHTDWQEAGKRRQAFYTDLPPGTYRFRVIASNNSGVWNETRCLPRFFHRAQLSTSGPGSVCWSELLFLGLLWLPIGFGFCQTAAAGKEDS